MTFKITEEGGKILTPDGFGTESVDKVSNSGGSVKEVSFSESFNSLKIVVQ